VSEAPVGDWRSRITRAIVMAGLVLLAAVLLLEAHWLAILLGSTYGVPVRRVRGLWWTLCECVCLAGALACDVLFAVLFARGRRGGATTPQALFGTPSASNPGWRHFFLGVLAAVAGTLLVALGLTLL
jgi:hypothetical protein